MTDNDREVLRRIAGDKNLLEIARVAIEGTLIEFRDARISTYGRNNGLVVKERSGRESSIIRMGPETAVSIGLKAIADYKEKNQ